MSPLHVGRCPLLVADGLVLAVGFLSADALMWAAVGRSVAASRKLDASMLADDLMLAARFDVVVVVVP